MLRRRGSSTLAVAVVVALAAAFVSCSDDEPVVGPGPQVQDNGDADGGPEDQAPSEADTGGDTGAPADPPERDGSPPTTQPSTATQGGAETLSPGGPPGSFAPAYLRPAPAESLVVELLVEENGLRQESIDHLTEELRRVTQKPVRLVAGSAPAGDGSWTADELRAAADAAGREDQGGGQAVMRLLVVGGSFADNDDALGVSVRGDVAAVFVDRVRAAGSPLGGSGRIERAVVLHEAGHLLGLVDLYLDTGREDPEHPGHSKSRDSVMYWAVESSLVVEILGGGPPTDFDAADLEDLARIRAGA